MPNPTEKFPELHSRIYDAWNRLASPTEEEEDADIEFADLELRDEIQTDVLDYALNDPPKEARLNPEFWGFGMRGDGSQVAIWVREGADVWKSPVFIIGSEGENGIVAADYFEFLQYSAMGYDMYQMLEEDLDAPWHSPCPRFADYLQTEFGLETPADPATRIAELKVKYRDWVADLQAT